MLMHCVEHVYLQNRMKCAFQNTSFSSASHIKIVYIPVLAVSRNDIMVVVIDIRFGGMVGMVIEEISN